MTVPGSPTPAPAPAIPPSPMTASSAVRDGPPSSASTAADDLKASPSKDANDPGPILASVPAVSKDKAPPSDEKTDGYAYNPGDRVFTLRPLREHWWQVWRWRLPPPPPPMSMADAPELPIRQSNFLSYLFFSWMTPLMFLGYRRPLEATDLWGMDKSRSAEHLSRRLLEQWDARVARAAKHNEEVASGARKPGRWARMQWASNYVVMGKLLRRPKALALPPSKRAELWQQPPPPGAYRPKPPKGAPIPPGGFPPIPDNYSGYQRASLMLAVHDVFKWEIWLAMFFRLVGDMSQLLSTLVLKQMIAFGQEVYAAHKFPELHLHSPPVGKGVAMAFGLFLMSFFASICQHHFFFRGQGSGIFIRAALISAIFSRGLKMNGQDRAPGKLTNHISTDVSRIDFAANWCVISITAPIQLVVALIILLCQIGYSALAGYAVLLVAVMSLMHAMVLMFAARKQSMVWTDKRAKAIAEILSSMQIVKIFGFEPDFLERLHKIRTNELHGIRSLLLLRSAAAAVAFSSTVLGSVVSFVVYNATGHGLDPAKIFSSLTLFNLTRMPLMIAPLALSSSTDALNAFLRLQTVFEAPVVKDENEYDLNSAYGIRLANATFQWTTVKAEDHAKVDGPKMGDKKKRNNKITRLFRRDKSAAKAAEIESAKDKAEQDLTQSRFAPGKDSTVTDMVGAVGPQLADADAESKSEPFAMRNLSLEIKRGELCAIVGAVGSGKSSLLEGCIGEMKRLGGRVIWGSRAIGYCPQTAWIRSATLRDNITFGRPFDPVRYWHVIKVAELENDLKMLKAGDMSEIGEKGVTLSGGQKQRVNLARALYFDPDVYFFDDPLSALDAHVGKAVFLNAILPLKRAGKTVILVTHALQYLSECDHIILLDKGEVVEEGGYKPLLQAQGPFADLIAEFGAKGGPEEDDVDEQLKVDAAEEEREKAHPEEDHLAPANPEKSAEPDTDPEKDAAEDEARAKKAGAIIEAEERNTGAVGWKVYSAYFKAGHGWLLVPASLASIALMQAAQVLNSYWLVWWEDDAFHSSRGMYMGVYAGLGVAQAIFTFLMGASMGYLSFFACKTLHARAMRRTMYAPMSFLDVTPQGRIMSRFAKDIDVLDNQLQDSVRMLVTTLASVLGAVILITVLTHYFIAIVAAILIVYVLGAVFYRSSAREIKRLDSLLRSALYSHFAESLSGIGTLRAYGATDAILTENYSKVDDENRAYLLTITAPRWLGMRLDVCGSLLILIVGLILVCTASSISPGQVGVALSYIVSTAQMLTMATRQVAEVENNMNAAERILYYADELPQEAEQVTPPTTQLRGGEGLPPEWPENGAIEFNDVKLRYRKELPLVLKGISMHVPGGTKVGIVGRTGAGKSSLLGAVLRLTELDEGSITIDGIDIAQVGLRDLRRRLAVLSQTPTLFSGTLRSNLDPFQQLDDARLWDALRRSALVGEDGAPTGPGGRDAISLDMPIEEGGNNLSLGQKSLVSLARALCKNSKIILLDEATASADSKTDALVQATIRSQFADRTLLCIAHRLATIISYDKIAVFSAGLLVEYDAPLALFDDHTSHFHDMCIKAGLGREDILLANGSTP